MVVIMVMVGIRGIIEDFTMTYIYFVNYRIDLKKYIVLRRADVEVLARDKFNI